MKERVTGMRFMRIFPQVRLIAENNSLVNSLDLQKKPVSEAISG